MCRILSLILACWLAIAGIAAAQQSSTIVQPASFTGAQRVLCTIRAANFNSTADQACAIPGSITGWAPTAIWVTNCSTSLAITLAAGGVYPAASKGGTPLVAAAQVYTALSAASVILPLTLAANIATTRYALSIVYLSLSVANGAPATCDFYVIGMDLS